MSVFEDNLTKLIVNEVLTKETDNVIQSIFPKIEKLVYDRYGSLPEIHIIKDACTGNERKLVATTHEKFERVLKCVTKDEPVYLTGRAGTGKNVIAKQVADALGLDFYFTNAITQEYKLTGFIDANGTYQETQFFQAFTKGGLFFLDEMDASIPEVLVHLNAALANKYFDFPIGKMDAHPKFRVIAAGNTIGLGADSVYTGRYKLDRASLDRFAMIPVDYSEKIELSLCANDKALVDFAHAFREASEYAGIECLFSYRSISRIYRLAEDIPLDEVLEMSLLKGLCQDDIETLRYETYNGLLKRDSDENKYYLALEKLALV